MPEPNGTPDGTRRSHDGKTVSSLGSSEMSQAEEEEDEEEEGETTVDMQQLIQQL